MAACEEIGSSQAASPSNDPLSWPVQSLAVTAQPMPPQPLADTAQQGENAPQAIFTQPIAAGIARIQELCQQLKVGPRGVVSEFA